MIEQLSAQLDRVTQRPLLGALAVMTLAVIVLLPGLRSDGFWEPHEIKAADQAWQELLPDTREMARLDQAARREREHEATRKPGQKPTKPPKSNRGAAMTKIDEPVFTEEAVRASIRTFGPSELSARLPIALMGLVAVLATFLLGLRLASLRAALIASLALVSFPLFLFHARTLNSDIGTICGSALIVLGAVGLSPLAGERRKLALGLVGLDLFLLAAGTVISYFSGGALLGLVVPFGAFGLAGIVWFASSKQRGPEHIRILFPASAALLCAAVAGVVVFFQIFELVDGVPGDRAIFGKTIEPIGKYSPALGGVWSETGNAKQTFSTLFEQIAFGIFPWVAIAPIAVARLGIGDRGDKKTWAGYVVFAWVALAWIVATYMERKVGRISYPALVPIALAAGVWIDDIVSTREDRDPDATALPLAAVFVFFAAAVIAKDLLATPDELSSLHLKGTVLKYPEDTKIHYVLGFSGMAFGGLLAVGLGLYRQTLPRNPLFLWLARAGSWGIGGALAASALFALLFTHVWSPSMATKMSSKQIFEAYHELKQDGDLLGIMGAHGSGPEYYAGDDFLKIGNRGALMSFLRREERVFALTRAAELCPVHKAAGADGTEYHVLDDRNASYLLLSNKLRGSEKDKNPLTRLVVRDMPQNIKRPLDANYDDKIQLIGVNMPRRVGRGDNFEVTLFYKVLKPVGKNWKIFLHFDGAGMRFQGDHDPIRGRCGTSYWQPGDYIIDTHELEAGGLSYPKTTYRVWAGFFVGSAGNWTNMTAKSGKPDKANRIPIGSIEVN